MNLREQLDEAKTLKGRFENENTMLKLQVQKAKEEQNALSNQKIILEKEITTLENEKEKHIEQNGIVSRGSGLE